MLLCKSKTGIRLQSEDEIRKTLDEKIQGEAYRVFHTVLVKNRR